MKSHGPLRLSVNSPGCVRLGRGRRDVQVLQGTAAASGRGAQGAGGRGHAAAAAGALREDWL